MTQSNYEKLLFKNDFNTLLEEQAKEAEIQANKNLYSDDEIDALRQAAYEEGKQAGRTESEDSIQNQLTYVVQNLHTELDMFQAQFSQKSDENLDGVLDLSLSLLKRLFPNLASQNGLQEVESFLKESFEEYSSYQNILIEVSPDIIEAIQEKFSAGDFKNIKFVANEAFGLMDTKISWESGFKEQNIEQFFKVIEKKFGLDQKVVTPEEDPIEVLEEVEQIVEEEAETVDDR